MVWIVVFLCDTIGLRVEPFGQLCVGRVLYTRSCPQYGNHRDSSGLRTVLFVKPTR